MNYKQIHKLYWNTVNPYIGKTMSNFDEWYNYILKLFKERKVKHIVIELNINQGYCNGITLVFGSGNNIVPILEIKLTSLKDYIKCQN